MAFWRAASRAARFSNPGEIGFALRHPYSTVSDLNFSSNSYNSTPRRMTCGELRVNHVGSLVELAGSLQEKRLGRFLLLRDSYGSTQLVIPDERPDIGKRLANLPLRSFISVIGYVIQRPQGAINETMVTGQVEVCIQDLVMVRVNRGHSNKILKDVRGRATNSRAMFARDFSTSAHTKTLTTEEKSKCKGNNSLKWQMKNRVETCANLNFDDIGRKVMLIGWMHSCHLPRFIKLKDGYGIIQCLIPSSKVELQETLQLLTSEDLVQISGEVTARPSSQVNLQEINGDIEILVETIGKLNPDLPVPAEEEIADIPNYENSVNSHTWRTHTCGELNLRNVGKVVNICGWLDNYRLGKFFTLRDAYGVTQCILNEDTENALDKVSLETILDVKGFVVGRPLSSVNSTMPTGEIEVVVSSVKVLNPASYIPFNVRSFNTPSEKLQLHNRYVYLRYPEMQLNLRTRSTILMNMRKYLIDFNQFVEVETPTLFCRTPGGAKEFIVPTRHKGHFYSLIQSPQQHKQMLMAGGIDRYFQVARCYRDEMTRGDRQPEFTQLDIEMSFAKRENILSLIEELIRSSWPHPLPSKPFPCLTYEEALSKYGSDKPDISFNLFLQDITDQLVTDEELVHSMEDFRGYVIVVKGSDFFVSNALKNMLKTSIQDRYKNTKFTITQIKDSVDQWCTNVKIFKENIMRDLVSKLKLSDKDTLFISYGPKDDVRKSLGDVRIILAKEIECNGKIIKTITEDNPMWIVDFPLFVKGDDNQLESCHHPFTAPHPDDLHLLETDPLKVRSLAYDLVIAGQEVGGGSVRIHNSQLQKKVLDMLKIPSAPLQHLINALESGCPPHAGIALGIDRLIAIACDTKSIRDVIAFPKSHDGKDPLSGAPSLLTPEEQATYHIQVLDSAGSSPKRQKIDN